MSTVREALPPEGDEEEAQELVRRHPIVLPTYKLERVHVATLNVDYAPPHGSGYARPLSQYRLAQLRREWDPLAVSPLTISRRSDNTLWVIDGNHRRYVGFEKGMLQQPAMVHSGLTRAQEADLYTKLGTVLGQTPWTRFLAKLAAGDETAQDIVRIAERHDLEVNGGRYRDTGGTIQAVARLEWIYARGGPEGLDWTLGLIVEAFDGARDALGEQPMEGAYGFYARYADLVDRKEVAKILGGSGLNAWFNRTDAISQRTDYGKRANVFGVAIAEMVNETWRRRGRKVKELLPPWEQLNLFGSRYRDVTMRERGLHQWRSTGARGNLTPQHLV